MLDLLETLYCSIKRKQHFKQSESTTMIENNEINQESTTMIENTEINQEMFKIADELFDVTKIINFNWQQAINRREPHLSKRTELIKNLMELSVVRLFKDDIKTNEYTSKIVHARAADFWKNYCEKYGYTKSYNSASYKDTAMRIQAKELFQKTGKNQRLKLSTPEKKLKMKARQTKHYKMQSESLKQLQLQATTDPDAANRLKLFVDKRRSRARISDRKKRNKQIKAVTEMDEMNKIYGIKWIGKPSTEHRKTGYTATKYLREILNDDKILPELETSCWEYQTWKKESNSRVHQLRNDFKFTHPGLIKYGFSTIIIEYHGSQHLNSVQDGIDENKSLTYAKTRWSGIADEIGNMNPSLINRMKMIMDNDYAKDKCKLKDNTNQDYVVVLGFKVKQIMDGLNALFCNLPHQNVFKKANEVELYGQLHQLYKNNLYVTDDTFTWCVRQALLAAKLIDTKSKIIEQDEDKSQSITNSNDNNVAQVVQPVSATNDESGDDLSSESDMDSSESESDMDSNESELDKDSSESESNTDSSESESDTDSSESESETDSNESESDMDSNESKSDMDCNESELDIDFNENAEKNDVEDKANEISADQKDNTKNDESKPTEELTEDSHYMDITTSTNIYNFKRRFNDNNCFGVEFIPKIKTSNLNSVQK